jgi:chemotaxis protein methyltransferase CheR
MQDTTFNEIADLALRHTGQAFAPSKSYLMEARLAAISRRESFATLDDLAHCLKARPNLRFEAEIAAALTGKLTGFFAERDLIDRLVSHALPARLKTTATGRLRVWCAGVSTGQEAWSLAIALSEVTGGALKGADIEIVGTDISSDALQHASTATYGHFDVQKGLSIHRLMANFTRHDSGDWQIKDHLRGKVKFRRHNLIKPAGDLGHFDVILCRNVLKGMIKPMRAVSTEHMARQLLPGGYMLTGVDESLIGVVDGLTPNADMRGAFSYKAPKGDTVAA